MIRITKSCIELPEAQFFAKMEQGRVGRSFAASCNQKAGCDENKVCQLPGGHCLPFVVAAAAEPPTLVVEPSSKRSIVSERVPWLITVSARKTVPKPGT